MIVVGCALLIATLLLSRWLERSWLTPGTFFSLFWVGASIPACLIGFPVTGLAMIVVMLFCLSCAIGSALGLGPQQRAISTSPPLAKSDLVIRHRELRIIVVVCGIAGLLAPVLLMLSQGRSVSDLASPSAWLEFAAYITVQRYKTDYTDPLLVRGLVTATYLGSLVGGLLLRVRCARSDVATGLLPTLAGIAMSLATTAKATFMLSVVLTVSAYLASGFLREPDRERKPTVRGVVGWMVAGVTAFSLILAAMMVRYQEASGDIVGLLADHVLTYAWGHMSAFSAWLEKDGFGAQELAYGLYTFAGPAASLGLFERAAGIYTEISYNDYTVDSNIFTLFRGLILDAGPAGALLITGLTGFAAGRAVRWIRIGRSRPLSAVVLAAFYAFTLWSFVLSVFTYNSPFVAFVVYAFVVHRILRAPKATGRTEGLRSVAA